MSSGSMTGTQVAPYITNGAGVSIVKIQWNGGQIKANNAGVQNNVQAFNQDQWYDIKVVINTSSDTYDLDINGDRKLTGQALAVPSGGSVGKVTLKMDSGNNTGTIYYDNLKIYTTKPSATVTGLEFDPATYNVYTGDVIYTVVKAVYSDNSKQVITSGNSFSSLNTSIASIDQTTGKVTANIQGTTQVSVSNSVYSTLAAATVIVWTEILAGTGNATVAEIPSASDKSLGLFVANKTDAAEANRIFTGLTGKVAIEA